MSLGPLATFFPANPFSLTASPTKVRRVILAVVEGAEIADPGCLSGHGLVNLTDDEAWIIVSGGKDQGLVAEEGVGFVAGEIVKELGRDANTSVQALVSEKVSGAGESVSVLGFREGWGHGFVSVTGKVWVEAWY